MQQASHDIHKYQMNKSARLIDLFNISAYHMARRVLKLCINTMHLCYMDDNIQFEHNSKVAHLVVVIVACGGCAPRTF